ncbi:hypothetical protein [Atlantibacter hermannii]|uniref:hypothetical protein n=1 Tax=Atlantibacter hermannii TaxID=565 RepID=UPI0013EEEA51|nr:hypothetical protein [Atlantibacter hermannii]
MINLVNRTKIIIAKYDGEADMKAKYKVIYFINNKRHEFETVIERDDKSDEAEVYSQIMPEIDEHYKAAYGVGSFVERKGFSEVFVEFLGWR